MRLISRRTARLRKKAGRSRLIGRTKGRRHTRLNAVCANKVRPVQLYPGAGRTRDSAGAAGLLATRVVPADRGHDADWLRNTLIDMGIARCTPSNKNRKLHIEHDATLHTNRHKTEPMFGRMKHWRRIAMRFDRRADIFLPACALAAVVIVWP